MSSFLIDQSLVRIRIFLFFFIISHDPRLLRFWFIICSIYSFCLWTVCKSAFYQSLSITFKFCDQSLDLIIFPTRSLIELKCFSSSSRINLNPINTSCNSLNISPWVYPQNILLKKNKSDNIWLSLYNYLSCFHKNNLTLICLEFPVHDFLPMFSMRMALLLSRKTIFSLISYPCYFKNIISHRLYMECTNSHLPVMPLLSSRHK